MLESPPSLQQVCVDFICDNVLALCRVGSGDSGEAAANSIPTCSKAADDDDDSGSETCKDSKGVPSSSSSNSDSSNVSTKLMFKDPDAFLPTEISENLLYNLCEKRVLSDLTIGLFDARTTRLKYVRLKDASNLTIKGLKVMRQHKIVDLEINGLKIAPNELIACLSDWSWHNLRSLNIARGKFIDFSRYCVLVSLCKLQSLQTLNVSDTDFNSLGLEIIAQDLPLLESLDISSTRVDDITPLLRCKGRLKTLIMYNLQITSWSVLREITTLKHLDISGERKMEKMEMSWLLKAMSEMPLISLDISGRDDVEAEDLRNFINVHPNLEFLGLVHLENCYEDSFVNQSNKSYKPNLVVSGTATESQLLEALRRYPNRHLYVQKCLYSLFRLTRNYSQVRDDIVKLVISASKAHPQISQVQTAATACLYKLTKDELASKIHSTLLSQIVNLTLTAMELHPSHYQLQKNALLTLCSDRILQDVAFDKYRCTRLVMNCLSAFDDQFMNRMSVAICSILAARITTLETSIIGSNPEYMLKLVQMVRSKVESKSSDICLKFTLSCLWNLTDESSITCHVVMQTCGGTKLFLQVLDCFVGESSIETKVLGLLNNIAEVDYLRKEMMQRHFLKMLSILLDSAYIDVSYFAAGVTAHLLSDTCLWSSETLKPKRVGLVEQLENAILTWEIPQREMVAYRSFKPFLPLLSCADAYPVRLWAIWAIHHVCSKNPKRYCEMLVNEGGVEILHRLEKEEMKKASTSTKSNVHNLCCAILDILARHTSC